MAEPKKRLTSTRSGNRRSQIKAKKTSLAVCSKCNSKLIPHRICPNCGYYKGNDILKLEEKAQKKEERRKEKEEAEKAAEEAANAKVKGKKGKN